MKLFVYGSDYYLAKEYITSVTKNQGDVRFYSFYDECENVLVQLSQQSLFGEAHIPVFYDVHSFVEQHIDQMLVSVGSWVIWEPSHKIPFEQKVNERLLSEVKVKQIVPLSERETENWLQDKAKEYNLTISKQCIAHLVSLHGNDLKLLQCELQKLFWYTKRGVRCVTKVDIDTLSYPTKEGNIFSLMDSIGERNITSFTRAFTTVYSRNTDEWQVYYMTIRHIRLLLKIKTGATVKVPSFVKQKLTKQASKWNVIELISVLGGLSLQEYQVKTGKAKNLFPGYLHLMLSEVCSSEI